MYFLTPVLCLYQIGKLEKLVRCSIRVVPSMVNDENLLQRLRILRANPMYKPEALLPWQDDDMSRYVLDDAEEGGTSIPVWLLRGYLEPISSWLQRVRIGRRIP